MERWRLWALRGRLIHHSKTTIFPNSVPERKCAANAQMRLAYPTSGICSEEQYQPRHKDLKLPEFVYELFVAQGNGATNQHRSNEKLFTAIHRFFDGPKVGLWWGERTREPR